MYAFIKCLGAETELVDASYSVFVPQSPTRSVITLTIRSYDFDPRLVIARLPWLGKFLMTFCATSRSLKLGH